MTIVSNTYDAYITLLQTALPNYARIPNGLDAQNAVSLFKRAGYALIPTGQINTNRLVGCKASFVRNYTVSLFNKVTATENNTTATDSIIKNMLEDAVKIEMAVERSTVLNNVAVELGSTKFIDDTGIFFVAGEREKFLQLDINFETEYFITI